MTSGARASALVRAAGAVGMAAMVACDGSPALSPVGADTTTGAYAIRLFPARADLVVAPGAPSSITLTLVVLKLSDTTAVPSVRVTWSTEAASVATVTTAGTVTAVAPGTTILHARYSGADITAPVTVAPMPVSAFVRTGSMSRARVGHTATLLANGKVLIVGGGSETAELYDPTSGTFAPTGSMSVARANHSATLLPDGRVLVAGGTVADSAHINDGAFLKSAEVYDPAAGTFSRTGDMLEAQSWQSATLLSDGTVLLTGGMAGSTSCCGFVPAPERYDPASGVFRATGAYVPYSGLPADMETWGLTSSTATLLRDGKVLIAAEPAAQLYDPVTGTFALTGRMTTAGALGTPTYIVGRTATSLEDGRVFLAGGEHEDVGRFASTELYDPTSGTFASAARMAMVRDGQTATLLPDGKVLVVGGESEMNCGTPSTCEIASTSSAELYDPAGAGFASAGDMNEPREWHRATLLNDGGVLITGGITFIGGPAHFATGVTARTLASAELYVGRTSVNPSKASDPASRLRSP